MADIRSIRTKEKLRESLAELLQSVQYEKINVSEIADNAKINRVTFYTHYQDKDALLKDLVDNFSSECLKRAIEVSREKKMHNASCGSIYQACVLSFVNYCISKKQLLSSISQTKDGLILSYFSNSITNAFINATQEQVNEKQRKFPFTVDFIIAGYIEVVFSWLMNPYCPQEEFIRQIDSFTSCLVKSGMACTHE